MPLAFNKPWFWFTISVASIFGVFIVIRLYSSLYRDDTGSFQHSFKAWEKGVVTVIEPEIKRDCQKAFSGDKLEVSRIKFEKMKWKNRLKDTDIHAKTKNCSWVRNYFHDNLYTTKLEKSFPLAFSFVIHNGSQQILRLFRVLYRPHNLYCFHPDLKSDRIFTETFVNIVSCLDNVFITTKSINVRWGHFSLMEAQMSCLDNLVYLREQQSREEKWKYVINLCGKELPLTTNSEIVSRLMKLEGSSAITARIVTSNDRNSIQRLRKKRIPFNLPYYKSMTYMGISYKFAHFILTSPVAMALHSFFQGCKMPEEHFYATLYMVKGAPGGFNSKVKSRNLYFNVDQYFWLRGSERRYRGKCNGIDVHDICVVSIGDLAEVLKGSEHNLFHNKYLMEYDHTIMDCMEERLVELNKEEYQMDYKKMTDG